MKKDSRYEDANSRVAKMQEGQNYVSLTSQVFWIGVEWATLASAAIVFVLMLSNLIA